jgi:hypothetical protein
MMTDDMNPTNRPAAKYRWPFPRRMQVTNHEAAEG